jgi:hypothetical protein
MVNNTLVRMPLSCPPGAVLANISADVRLQIGTPSAQPPDGDRWLRQIKRAILLSAAVALLPCAALAQLTDHRISELTQACDRSDMVHASVENLKRGVFSLGCVPVPSGREVRLIQRRGDVSQVDFCTSDGCYVAGC